MTWTLAPFSVPTLVPSCYICVVSADSVSLAHNVFNNINPSMQMDADLHVAETRIGAFTSSLTHRPSVQLDTSSGEDVARLRRDPSVQATLSIALECDARDLEYLRRIQALTQRAISELEFYSARHRAALAPIASCPPEVLADIFCLATYVEDADKADDSADNLLIITAVSKRWRDIALSARTLWATCSGRWCPGKQSTWLERSAPGPVDVIVSWSERPSLALCSQAHRWRSFVHDDPDSDLILDNMKILMDSPDLSNLVSIRIDYDMGIAPDRCDARNFRSKLPVLKSLHTPLKIDNLETIAGNLVDIVLSSGTYTSQELHKLFKSCNSTLVRLTITEYSSEAHFDFSLGLENIVFPKLQMLLIKQAIGPHLCQLLDIIHAPVLAHLAIPFTPTKQWVSFD